jgi:hypothetical protein
MPNQRCLKPDCPNDENVLSNTLFRRLEIRGYLGLEGLVDSDSDKCYGYLSFDIKV